MSGFVGFTVVFARRNATTPARHLGAPGAPDPPGTSDWKGTGNLSRRCRSSAPQQGSRHGGTFNSRPICICVCTALQPEQESQRPGHNRSNPVIAGASKSPCSGYKPTKPAATLHRVSGSSSRATCRLPEGAAIGLRLPSPAASLTATLPALPLRVQPVFQNLWAQPHCRDTHEQFWRAGGAAYRVTA